MKRFSVGVLAMCGVSLACVSEAHATETVTYTYDTLGRLVTASSAGSVNNGQNVSLDYDAADNRSSFSVSGVVQPTLSISPTSVTEGGTLTFTVSLSPAATGTVTVNYATSNGTAVAPGDYTSKSGTLTFSAGQTSKTITVSTINDTAFESNETLTVTLSSPSGAVIGTSSATGTIIDNDTSTATLSIGNASVTEGGTLGFVVTRTGNTASAVSASYASASGTATSGSDFTAKSGTVSFSAAQTSANITISTIDDTVVESSETMTVMLSSPSSGAAIGTSTGTGTIIDNDTSAATLSIGNATVTEGGTLVFTVTRTGNTASAVSASYGSASGTATAGSDFTAVSGTVSFAASQTTKTISVSTTDDTLVESPETMTVTLSSPSSGAVIGTATGTGTINDNDSSSLPEFTIDDASGTEGGTLVMNITRSGNTSVAVSINVSSASGTATKGSDFSGTSGIIGFGAGQTSAFATYNLLNNSIAEPTETFTVTISPTTAGSATILRGTATGTIFDDD